MRDDLFDFSPQRLALVPSNDLLFLNRPGSIFVLRISFEVSVCAEPPFKNGLAALCFRMLMEGTKSRTALEIAQALDDLGCEWNLFGQSLQIACLSRFQNQLLELVGDILQNSSFEKKRFKKLKTEILEDLKRNYEESENEAFEILRRHVFFGTKAHAHPLGTVREIQSLSHEELLEFRDRYLGPANLRFYVAGSVDLQSLQRDLSHSLFGLRHVEAHKPDLMIQTDAQQNDRLFVYRKRQQSVLCMGHSGVTRHHPDAVALKVGDQVFGSGNGLNSRLSRRLREELGLCYSVSGDIMSSAGRWPGMMQMSIGTAGSTVEQAVSEMLGCLQSFLEYGPTEAETEDTKSYLLGSQCFLVETCGSLVQLLREMDVFSLSEDFMRQERQKLIGISASEVRDAWRRHVSVQRLAFVLVGTVCPSGFSKANRKELLGL
ncbi:MAG: insulinase family protein [Candidatus Cloacimonetes bacterium]|nr:insulinase family protein [Candidatus Cloacimonadota bacterium]